MRLPPFELIQPATLSDAARALAEGGDGARLVAGGTALVPMMRLGLVKPERVVSLHRVPGLDGLTARDGALDVGAMVTMAQLSRSAAVRTSCPLLAEAAAAVATPAIRSAATIGGNLGYAEAASDLGPALLCLDAEVLIATDGGERRHSIAQFFTGFYETAVGPGEVVAGVAVPRVPRGAVSGYVKFCSRSAEDKPLVGVAALLVMDRPGARCREARIALAGVAPTAMRARRAELAISGGELSDTAIGAAAGAAASEIDPVSDLMGSADYRREMTRVWVRRVLSALRDGRPASGRPH